MKGARFLNELIKREQPLHRRLPLKKMGMLKWHRVRRLLPEQVLIIQMHFFLARHIKKWYNIYTERVEATEHE